MEPDLSNKTLFVIEDDQLTFLFIQQVFKKADINIVRASTGSEALEFIENNLEVDCVLVDIQLPDMSGIEVIGKIKEQLKNTPIIAQTASHSQEVKDEAINAGATDFIYKPYKPEDVLQKVRDLVF